MNYLYFSGAAQQDLKTLEEEVEKIDEQLKNVATLKPEDVQNLLTQRKALMDTIKDLKQADIQSKAKDYLTSPRGLITSGLRATAMALAYYRSKSLLRAFGASFVWLPYLIYVGYDEYKKKQM